MRRLIGAAGALALLVLPATGQAQDLCTTTFQPPAVGSWAEWRMSSARDSNLTMRMAVVGTEQRDGKTLTRLEMSNQTERGPMIVQVLASGWPYQLPDVQEMVMKMGNRPAMKMPQAMISRMGRRGGNPASSWKSNCKKMEVVGSEKLSVPAGSYSATHYRNTDDGSEVWIDKDLPFLMVKSIAEARGRGQSGTLTMELVGSGTGAKSSITETPQEMPGMGMPGGRSGR